MGFYNETTNAGEINTIMGRQISVAKDQNEPCHEKTGFLHFCICENKGVDQLCIYD